ncbi:MAG: methylenetetrahydrofolate reductase [Bacteriovoracaceae bacterium]
MSYFAKCFLTNTRVITAELCPPKGADLAEFMKNAAYLKNCVDAVNVTDNQRSVLRLSSLFASHALKLIGIEPIMQMTCRDRNALAIQSDLLGANSLGIKNILCLTGDPIRVGDHPDAKSVFEFNSEGLIKTVRGLNNGEAASGVKINSKTDFFIGAVANPAVIALEKEVEKMARKIDAGAKFFQTQPVFNLDQYEKFSRLAPKGAKILMGVLALKGPKMIDFLNNNVAGIKVPDELRQRFMKASEKGKEWLEEESITHAAELAKIYYKNGDGIHLMSIQREDLIPKIIKRMKEI